MNNNAKNGVKRAFILIFAGIILATLTWMGSNLVWVKGELKVLKAGVDIEVLKERVSTLERRIGEKTKDRYKGANATKDFKRINDQLNDMELRLRLLERE